MQSLMNSHNLETMSNVFLHFRVAKYVSSHVATFAPRSDDRSEVAEEQRIYGIISIDHTMRERTTDTRSRDVLNIAGVSFERISALTIIGLERSRFGIAEVEGK